MGQDVVILGMNGALSEGIGLLEPVAGTGERDSGEAFRQLSTGQVRSAFRLAFAILGDALEAEDAAQDAFTSAWRQRSTLRDTDRFEAWFGRILVNVCRDRLRKRARARRLPSTEADELLADPWDAALNREALGQALAALDPDRRVIVILRFWTDLAVDDIAERLGIPAGTVKSRLHSSMRQLRAALEELG
jgi:RNA polymerase sigma factor (sigma-70 family)